MCTWTIKVSFTDSKFTGWGQKTKPDRLFGNFRRPQEAYDHLVSEGWNCLPATNYQSHNYYRKGNLLAVITLVQVPEDLKTLQVLVVAPFSQA